MSNRHEDDEHDDRSGSTPKPPQRSKSGHLDHDDDDDSTIEATKSLASLLTEKLLDPDKCEKTLTDLIELKLGSEENWSVREGTFVVSFFSCTFVHLFVPYPSQLIAQSLRKQWSVQISWS
jgi:hypothetical protein